MSIRLSIISGEIIIPGTPIRIYSPHPVDLASARSGIKLSTATTVEECKVSVKEKMIEIDTHGLLSNPYVLRIRRLNDCKGRCINELPISCNIVVRSIKGQVESDSLIQHVVHLAVGQTSTTRLRPGEEAPAGTRYLEAVRVMDRRTQQSSRCYFKEDGGEVDGARILVAVDQRREKKFGRFHEALWNRLQTASDDDLHEVIVWPKIGDEGSDDVKTETESTSKRKSSSPYSINEKWEIIKLINSFGTYCEHNEILPRVCTKLTTRQLYQLASSNHIAKIFHNDKAMTLSRASLRSSLAISRANLVHPRLILGQGIKVAVWEEGPSDTTDLIFADRFQANPPASNHARLVSGVIKSAPNPNEPNGYAPECELYSANSYDDNALAWAIGKGCTVINHSAHKTSEEAPGELSDRDVISDWLATHSPFPTMVTAAGNFGAVTNDRNPKYVVHKAYNAIPVGAHASIFRQDISEARIPDWSNFKNPISPHSDRELPLLAGPGENISAVGLTMSGTSFSSPAVAGAVALCQSVAPALLAGNPAACRAIMLACAGRNVSGGLWAADISARTDARDGAGALDVDAAVQIAQAHHPYGPPSPLASTPANAAAAAAGGKTQWPRGWTSGVYTSASTPTSNRIVWKQHIHIPPSYRLGIVSEDAAAGLTFRATVTWNSRVKWRGGAAGHSNGLSYLPANLDIKILDGRSQMVVAFAATFDNNYEVCDFVPEVNRGYDIVVQEEDNDNGMRGGSGGPGGGGGQAVTWAAAWCLFYNDEVI